MTESNLLKIKKQYIKLSAHADEPKKIKTLENKLVSLAKEYTEQNKHPEADFLLGYFGLFHGGIHDIDIKKSITYLENAYKAGHMGACVLLSRIHTGEFDFITSKMRKPSKGILLLEEAVKAEHPYALFLMAKNCSENINYNDKMSALELAEKCRKILYIGGYYLEAYWLAYEGPGPYNMELSHKLFQEGYDKCKINDLFSLPIRLSLIYHLGKNYYEGRCVEQDKIKAIKLMQEAAQAGHYEATEWLSSKGHHISKDGSNVVVTKDSPMSHFTGDTSQLIYNDGNEPYSYTSEDNIREDSNGYYIINHPEEFGEEQHHKPPIRVRIHYPDESLTKSKENLINQKTLDDKLLKQLMKPLEKLPGLKDIKLEIEELIHYAFIMNKRKDAGLKIKSGGYHMLFIGNPGTGKTHIARILGGIFYQIGLLEKGHVIEANKTTMTGEYVGWAESKTHLLCNSALDGILFIDEAYTLTDKDGYCDFGAESINVLVKMMEDFNDRFVVIAAGYKDKMEQFIRSNPGLRSRFSKTIEFKNYSAENMTEIFEVFCKDNDYTINAKTKKKLLAYFKSLKGNDLDRFGNARGVRNLFDSTIRKQAMRLIKEKATRKKQLMQLKAEDIPNEKNIFDENITYFPTTKE